MSNYGIIISEKRKEMSRMKEYFTVNEAAEKFGVTRQTIDNWCRSGKIKYCVLVNGRKRFTQEQIDNFIIKERK